MIFSDMLGFRQTWNESIPKYEKNDVWLADSDELIAVGPTDISSIFPKGTTSQIIARSNALKGWTPGLTQQSVTL